MPSKQCKKFLHALNAKIPKGKATLAEFREGFEKLMEEFPASPDIECKDTTLGTVPAYIIRSPKVKKERIILFFHGGGFVAGSTKSHLDFLGRLSSASKLEIVSVEYRLAPEFPFPAALEDAQEAYEALRAKGYSSDQIVLAGMSAGAGLAFSLLYTLKEKGETMPSIVLGLCPWLDLTFSEPSLQTNVGRDVLHEESLQLAVDWYCSKEDVQNPLISPLFGDPIGFPPTYILTDSSELLFDENVHFVKKLLACHVPVLLDIEEELFHCWFLYSSKIPEGQQAIERIAEYIWNA